MEKSEKYSNLIELIDKAGGIQLKGIKLLTFSERNKVVFNIWAFLFTIFYYIYIGCWKKGISYLVLTTIISILIAMLLPKFANMTWIITSVIFATRANIDIYKKVKLNQAEWI